MVILLVQTTPPSAGLNLEDPQHVYFAASIIFYLVSLVSVLIAVLQYRTSLRQRTAQSLMDLEGRLTEFKEILPLVDPESGRYDGELRPSVDKSLRKAKQSERTDTDRSKILLLDRFLRFLLLLTALQEYQLLKRDALRFMYWYWFKAINENPHLRLYVDSYFPTLATALDEEPVTAQPGSNERRFVKKSLINASPARVFEFHEDENVLSRLTPPWIHLKILETAKISEPGSRTVMEVRVFGIKRPWIAEHTSYSPPQFFTDVQIKGPFKRWSHRHTVYPVDSQARLVDEVTYEPPLGAIGRWLAPLLIDKPLQKLFDYRHEVTRRSCEETGESSS